ncbi:MAG TPA: hypothetical protein VK489_14660 [Ferruginibacter sp.]|nr:hypothetical protein [Ferruginibacter sp.]
MRRKKITFILLLTAIAIILVSESFVAIPQPAVAEQGDMTNCGPVMISKPNGITSHFFGLNCQSCHVKGRKGSGCFTVAGSVFDEDRSKIYKNPVVKLYTQPRGGGKLVATLTGDKLGNFFTTKEIDFGGGLFATLVGTPGVKEPIKHMLRPIFTGDCNNCHGKNFEALGID